MSDGADRLLDAIARLADELPPAAIDVLAGHIAGVAPGSWLALRAVALQVLPVPHAREQVSGMLAVWQQQSPAPSPASVALALQAAARMGVRQRQSQSLELVWTGPASAQPLRRTAQVLQELIDGARRELLIVSYAVYDIPETRAALSRALDRGVRLTLVVESPRESDGRIAYDGLLAFGPAVRSRATVYRWPSEQRPTDDEGRLGALHAKCAVADRHALLITSANLTHYALSLNMELGLVVRGGPLPQQVAAHLDGLIQSGVLAGVE